MTANGLIYYSPYTAAGLPNNAAANGVCDFTGLTDLIPSEKRHSVIATIRQEIGDKFTGTVDVVYSNRKNHQTVARGSASATIFGPGSANAAQINPFFTLPTGVVATSETVNFDADALFGPGAYIDPGAENFYVAADGVYRVTDTWNLNLGVVAGRDSSRQFNSGQLNASAYNLAVNGTTNGGGNLTAPSISGLVDDHPQHAADNGECVRPLYGSGQPIVRGDAREADRQQPDAGDAPDAAEHLRQDRWCAVRPAGRCGAGRPGRRIYQISYRPGHHPAERDRPGPRPDRRRSTCSTTAT